MARLGLLFAKLASSKPQRKKHTSRTQQGLEPLIVEETPGVVGSAETGSSSRGPRFPSGSLYSSASMLIMPMELQNVLHRL